jgi:hypothetical protein
MENNAIHVPTTKPRCYLCVEITDHEITEESGYWFIETNIT